MQCRYRGCGRPALALGAALLSPAALAATLLQLHPAGLPAKEISPLSAILEDEAQIRLERSTGGDDPLAALADGSADIAIVENTRPFVTGVRAVLPIYEAVVHIAVRSAATRPIIDAEHQRVPVVEFAGAKHTAVLVAELLFERAESMKAGYRSWEPETDAEPPDLMIYVGPIAPRNTDWFREGFTLVSLSRIDAAGAEFFTEGISYLHPQLRPTRIPALTYRLPGNETGIESLGVDMLVLTRRDVDASVIYRLARTLLEQKPRLAATEPQLFRWLREDFPRENLSFPLHQGARDYFNRDEPGFLERYAELLNFLVYVVVLAITGILALGRWRAHQRKERIDRFYEKLLALRRRGAEPPDSLIGELDALEEEAFGLLMDERLAADESFRIFTDFAARIREELRVRRDAG